MTKKITALVPAFNEEAYVGATVKALREIEEIQQIVVIDDGSTDNTARIARELPIELLHLPVNQGKGQALNAGWARYPADIYLLADADLGASAIHLEKLLAPVTSGSAQMAIANFTPAANSETKNKSGLGIAKTFAAWGIHHFTKTWFNSPLSGQRAVTNTVLKSCGGFAPGFGCEVALTIGALQNGFQVVEIDLPLVHRPTGRNLRGFWHRGGQFWAIVRQLYRAGRRAGK